MRSPPSSAPTEAFTKEEGKPVILVAPARPRRARYAEIIRLAVGKPWTLPFRPDLLSQGPVFHHALQSLNLTVLAIEAHILKDQGLSCSVVTTLINARKPASRAIYYRIWRS